MIRRATLDDMPRILDLGAEFLSFGPYAWVPLDRDAFAESAAKMIEVGVIFLAEDGMLGGVFYPFYFNPSIKLAAELFWYSPKNGRELREAFEDWAKSEGCAGVTCSGLANDRETTIRKLFGRAGYEATEVAFVKRFAA